MRALLDINVIIALLDKSHVHHSQASTWLADHIKHGWASCPITQVGVIRIMSQPTYKNSRPPAVVAQRLHQAMKDKHHEFWPVDVDLVGGQDCDWRQLLSGRHATDVLLLALAARRGGRFVTFDRHVPLDVVSRAAARHLTII